MSLIVNLLLIIFAISLVFFFIAKANANNLKVNYSLHSLPIYHASCCALASLLPAIILLFVVSVGDQIFFKIWIRDFYPTELNNGNKFDESLLLIKVLNFVQGNQFGDPEAWVISAGTQWKEWANRSDFFLSVSVPALSILGGLVTLKSIKADYKARNKVETVLLWILGLSSTVAIITTIGIVLSVLFESIRFFKLIPIDEFLFGLTWNPQFEGAERAGSEGSPAKYGMLPMFVGTFLISFVALSVAVPVGLLSAIYLAEYASIRTRSFLKPLLEILAGVPTVVYGFFAALTIAPLIRNVGEVFGFTVASESALAAGLVMGVMIIPFISSLSDDVINAVPQSLRDASLGLGATKSETTMRVVIPAAFPGIVASIILAVSRAIGETMIVVMAAGLAANLSFNPLDAVTTVTAQIVTILVGDQEFESAKTLSAFALALVLITVTLFLNFIALQVVKKYREQYE